MSCTNDELCRARSLTSSIGTLRENDMAGRLEGRRALVTGAGGGIGAATALRLARDGAQVFTTDRAGPVDLLQDITVPGAAEALLAAHIARHGGLDILVCCAGISRFGTLEDPSDALWDETFAINVTAIYRQVRAALPALKASPCARVVTIGSILSSFGMGGLAAYAASKHAVLGLSRALATELGPLGITVNCVQPGAIETPMTAPMFDESPEAKAFWTARASLGRLGAPADIADVIGFLVSDDARFVSGHGIFVDGAAMQHI